MADDPTTRFSDRVEYYLRYRPHYPKALLEFFRSDLALTPDHIIADIGSGTGFLAQMFLRNGNTVYGVEPNQEMREAGEKLLGEYPQFISVDGTAEATTLAEHAIDVIVAAQAFHWFDPQQAREEFLRILKPGGIVALIWNNRLIDASLFSREYETLVQHYSTDLDYVVNRSMRAMDRGTMEAFFGPDGFKRVEFDNQQMFDFGGLRGRLLSSSYAPLEAEPQYQPMMHELQMLFNRYQENGAVCFDYKTEMYYGTLA
jgi:SAM-dependent methyltransferase